MKKIILLPTRVERLITVCELGKLISYDPHTGKLYWKYRNDAKTEWNSRYAHKEAGTLHKVNLRVQVRITINGTPCYFQAHRIAWALVKGEWPDHFIDHRDNVSSNNIWVNLRAATSSQNNCNRASVEGTLKYKGVYYVKHIKKFGAQIKKDKKWEWLGVHKTAKEAAIAYDLRAIQLHGEYARTNASLGLV